MPSILAINIKEFHHSDVAECSLRDKTAFAGHDIVIVNMSDIAKGYATEQLIPNARVLRTEATTRFMADMTRRRQEAIEFLDSGGIIIYFLPDHQVIESVASDQSGVAKGRLLSIAIWRRRLLRFRSPLQIAVEPVQTLNAGHRAP